jgi:multicomponent K+:H+ antiporter subunit E
MTKFFGLTAACPTHLFQSWSGYLWLMLSHSLDASDFMAALLAVLIPQLLQHFITSTPHIDSKSHSTVFCGALRCHCREFCGGKTGTWLNGQITTKWFRVPLDLSMNRSTRYWQ